MEHKIVVTRNPVSALNVAVMLLRVLCTAIRITMLKWKRILHRDDYAKGDAVERIVLLLGNAATATVNSTENRML